MVFISIIIPTFNRCDFLEKCLSSIKREITTSENVEIIVVDDGSFLAYAKENKSICERYSAFYLKLDKNHGMAVARNRGVEICSGEWLVFIDDDIEVDIGWYTTAISILKNISPDIVAIEGKINAIGEGVWDREVRNEKGNAYLTCHLIVRRNIFEKSGRFDEVFEKKGPYCEDHELAARLLQWGEIIFVEKLSVTHQPRKIRLLKQILYSPIRIVKHLKAEYYFYKKHPDRYHLFRKHPNIWGTLFSISLFHIRNEFRRRSFYVLLINPLQTISLLLSSFFEQITALFYSIYLLHSERNFGGYFSSLIDVDKTKRFWNIENTDLKILRLNPQRIKRKLLSLYKRYPVYNILYVLKKLPPSKKCKIYLRIDDFCLEDFNNVKRCCEILREHSCYFLAAIVGEQLQQEKYKEVINYIRKCGGIIALHGFTHEGKFGPFNSELLQLPIPEIIKRTEAIRKSQVFENNGLHILVPPYNAIGTYQIYHLSPFFKIICGGPESVRFTDRYIGPIFLKNGGCYFPSIEPFYGSAAEILSSHALEKLPFIGGTICITTHFFDEVKDYFKSFSLLINSLPSSAEDWNLLY
ncbi:MAG: glycosyltransferase [Chitinispirillaceae bacterium]|nr:glycosyltransferase [Chitinispirillaceae bacterium]